MEQSLVNTDNNKYTIHIIDDSKTMIALISSALEEKGYKVTHSMNGKDGLGAIYHHKPTLLILDVEMPIMDGYETIKYLKKDKKIADIPVIFNTTLTKPEVVKKLFDLGASDYISKPFIPEELLARVEKEIRNITLQTELKKKMSKLAELVSTDSITRTSNRTHMTSILNAKLKVLSNDARGSFSLMLIDIDGFNVFSKIHGIYEAEIALRKFATILKKTVREKDVVSHWGADLFLLMFPQIVNDKLDEIAKTLKEKLTKVPFAKNEKLTCSIVMYKVNQDDTVNNIIKTMSDKLASAKKINKNSIVNTEGRMFFK